LKIEGSRFLIAGATGVIGGKLAAELDSRGARLVLAGRDRERLTEMGREMGCPVVPLDFSDPGSSTAVLEQACVELGGLDGLVVATGAVAFGDARDLDPEVLARLIEANASGPIHLITEGLGRIEPGGSVVAITAVVAEFPTAGMAAYSASKAALAAFLAATRRELRREVNVLEVSPGHMETGFADRALAGEPPAMPEGEDVDALVGLIVEAIEQGRREIRYDPKARETSVK
jgi:short-subunit dehydrogenase